MALNVLSHWSLNDPTVLTRFWDNSGNGHHGDFGTKKPEVVLDSPNGSRAMHWPSGGANVVLPDVNNVLSISYWIKRESEAAWNSFVPADGQWHLLVVSDKVYLDLEEVQQTKTVSDAITELRSAMNGGNGFYLSDLYYYGQVLDSTNIQKIYEVKTRLSKDYTLESKEILELSGSAKIGISKAGIVSADSFEVVEEGKAVFSSTGKVTVNKIVEN